MSVYKAIAAVQAELAKEGISKSRNNQQQNYKFRGIDDIYNALASLLSKNGLCILPRVLSRHCDERTTKSGSPLFYVIVECEFDLVSSEDGSKHTVKVYGEAMDSADKATNKAMSAAYKYMALEVFCIPTEGDNDADATTHEVKAKPESSKSVALVAWEGLDLTTQQRLSEVIAITKEYLDQFDDLGAVKYAYSQVTDADEIVAMSSQFDSKQRARLKAADKKLKEQEANKEFA